MTHTVSRWLALSNLAVAVALVAVSVSLNKTILRVNENTMQTLTNANDQHTDFVRHMLDFVSSQAAHTMWIASVAVVWLLVNAAVYWRCFGKSLNSAEVQSTLRPPASPGTLPK